MSKEGVSANTERVFRENETKANRMLTLAEELFVQTILPKLRPEDEYHLGCRSDLVVVRERVLLYTCSFQGSHDLQRCYHGHCEWYQPVL